MVLGLESQERRDSPGFPCRCQHRQLEDQGNVQKEAAIVLLVAILDLHQQRIGLVWRTESDIRNVRRERSGADYLLCAEADACPVGIVVAPRRKIQYVHAPPRAFDGPHTNARYGIPRTRIGVQQKIDLSGALAAELRLRCEASHCDGAVQRRLARDRLMMDAGQLSYDHIEHEFQHLARRLAWPAAATLKDFRHLFSTCLESAGMPEYYRRYLMGHAFGNAPIVTYTHLAENQIEVHYQRVLETELAPVVEAINRRAADIAATN